MAAVSSSSASEPEDAHRLRTLRETLVKAFSEFLPGEAVLHTPETLKPFECDGLPAYRQTPLIAVLPESISEVQRIMRLCMANHVPVVARGAGTGLSGGALPLEQGVLLSLAKFNRILELDPDRRTATVQPGVRNLAISEAADPHNQYYAPDPSSQIACSIGGNVAENSGGLHCLKYGLTVHNVLALKIVTVEGELLEIGSAAPDSPGYDMLALLNGSEGMLGIIVEVTVRLLPKPAVAQVVLGAFDDVEKCGAAVADIIATGTIPAGLEMMDRLAIEAAEDFAACGYPRDAEAILLCEVDGIPEEVDAQLSLVERVLADSGATSVHTARDELERTLLWKGRKSAFPAVGRISPDYYCIDGTIPRKRLAEVLRRIQQLSAEYDLSVANVFHAGDGNLHPLILFDSAVPGQLEQTEEFGGRILELCVEVGGTITGEHGVGVEKLDQMCVQFPVHELSQFHAVKAAWDSESLLNPGKAIPTLTRCAEFGAMHVHHGNMPHPELERF